MSRQVRWRNPATWHPCPGVIPTYDDRVTGTLVILRHGESTWNQLNLFTGWHDVPLNDKGLAEGSAAGQTMADAGLRFDVGHTSVLARAVVTCHLESSRWVSGGRFRLGLGVSHGPAMERLGVATGKPLADTRAYVEGLRAAACRHRQSRTSAQRSALPVAASRCVARE